MDREKVITEIVERIEATLAVDSEYVTIPLDLLQYALALLKEQEAVEPKQVDLYGNDEWWGLVCVCTDCNAEWMTDKANTHFCPNCGRSVKWE